MFFSAFQRPSLNVAPAHGLYVRRAHVALRSFASVVFAAALAFAAAPSDAYAKPTKRTAASAKADAKRGAKGRGKARDDDEPSAPAPANDKAATSASADKAPAARGDKKSSEADDDANKLQRGERVEFDARLIQGQTAKAGAVYLFARVSTNLKSMVKERSSFREKVVRTVYPRDDGRAPGDERRLQP
jgi:hypothetical protein